MGAPLEYFARKTYLLSVIQVSNPTYTYNTPVYTDVLYMLYRLGYTENIIRPTKENQMNIEQIAKSFWTNGDATRALAKLVREHLDQQSLTSPSMGSTKLLYALLPDPDAMQSRNVINHLKSARDKGYLDGYFDRGPKKGMGGHLVVNWHACKVEPVSTEDAAAFADYKAWVAAGEPACGPAQYAKDHPNEW